MTGKIGLQEIEGCDPIFIVKLPKQYRMAPPGVVAGTYVRSTWFLKHGHWQCVESRQRPTGFQPINEWVERALFQFHPLRDAVPAPPNDTDGSLILSIARLVTDRLHHIISISDNSLQVIIVHGGRGGSYSELSHQFEMSDGSNYKDFVHNTKRQPTVQNSIVGCCRSTGGLLGKDKQGREENPCET